MDDSETGYLDKPKPTWQNLLYLVMGTEMTPHQILCHLDIPPSRLRRLLLSKRLNQRLAMMQGLSTVRAGHLAVCYSDHAVRNLLRLTEKAGDAVSRNASRDLLTTAGNVLKGRTGPVMLDEAIPKPRLEQKTGGKPRPFFPTQDSHVGKDAVTAPPQTQKTPSGPPAENSSHAK